MMIMREVPGEIIRGPNDDPNLSDAELLTQREGWFERLSSARNVRAPARSSGSITIEWEDFGDEREPNFQWTVHWDPPLDRADKARIAMLLRDIADRHEAEVRQPGVNWPKDEG
jgi:hypothetical protein